MKLLTVIILSLFFTACTSNGGKPPLPGTGNAAQQSAVQSGLQNMDALDDSEQVAKDTIKKK